MRAGEYFYRTQAWKDCRDAYRKSVGGLCERCYGNGSISVGEIVHHKIHITQSNLDNVDVLLNWNNLELLCRKCHAEEHPEIYNKQRRRYRVDELGRVTIAPVKKS